MGFRFILFLLFAIVVAVFAIQNAGIVGIQFFSMQFSVSQALVILISVIFGAIAVTLLSLVKWVRIQSKLRSALKTVDTLEEENRQLKKRLEAACPSEVEARVPLEQTIIEEKDPD